MSVARSLGARVFGVALAAACGTRPQPVPMAPASAIGSLPASPELQRAVDAWHEQDDIEPLRRYVAHHSGAGGALGLWREVVALHTYRGAYSNESGGAKPQLHELARRFPETVAGRLARANLAGDRLARLRAEMPGRALVDFLGGGDGWCRDGTGALQLSAAEQGRARGLYGPELRAELGTVLERDQCREHLEYCLWWIEQYPTDELTAQLKAAVRQVWYDRGHPTWRGRDHARCASRCVASCKPQTASLEDRCWAPCYARC